MGLKLLLKCSLVSLAVLMTASAFANEHFPFVGKVTSDQINVRAGASTNYERIDQLALNAPVLVLAHQYEWYQIQLQSTAELYIRSDYLKIVKEGVGQVIGDRVNVRAKPNSDSSAVGQLLQGTLVLIKATKDQWTQIIPPKGITGWVNQRFIVITSPTVTDDLLVKDVTLDTTPVLVKKELIVKEVTGVKTIVPMVSVSVEGVIKATENPKAGESRYQLFINNRPAYFLTDSKDLEKFVKKHVKIVGEFPADVNEGELPVVHVSHVTEI